MGAQLVFRSIRGLRCALAAVLVLGAATGMAQQLRFSDHREVAIPEYATLRAGPFYSTVVFSQSAGLRYSTYSGSGENFYLDNDLGRITDEGIEFPLVSTLSFRNYLLINAYTDLDLSFLLRYAYFPMNTQDNEFWFTAIDPGIVATFGGFTFRVTEDEWYGSYAQDEFTVYATDERVGSFANIDFGFQVTPFVKARLYFRPTYRVD